MAEVVRAARIREQVALIAGLRWRMFGHSLRSTSARFELAAQVVVLLFFGLFAASLGIGFGAGAFYSTAHHEAWLLTALLWAIFLAWHFLPVMMATAAASFDFRNLLRFPLRYPAFFLLSLAYGLFDPAAVAALYWLVCMTVGTALARVDLLPWVIVVFAAFAAMNLLLARAIFTWLERLLAHRRARETFWAVFLLLMLSLQFSGAFAERWGPRAAPVVRRVLPALQVLPPGVAGMSLEAAAAGNVKGALASMALLAAYGLVFGWLLHRRLRAQFFGEDLGESPAPAARRPASATAALSSTSSTSSASFLSSVLPGPVAALLGKELRYLFRNSVLLVTLAIPTLIIAIFGATWSRPRHRPGLFSHSPDLAFPAAIAYMFLILAPLAQNCFAYEGRGMQLFYVLPLRFRDVLLGKNLLLGLVLALETALVWLVVSVLLQPPGAFVLVQTLSALPLALLLNCTAGNWLSLRFPRRFEFGQYRGRANGIAALAGLGLQLLLVLMIGITYLLARLANQMWLAPVLYLGLGAAALLVYRATLEPLERLASEQRESLISQLVR